MCTHHVFMTHLLPLVLGQVGLELEVGLEPAGAELALVGAVYHHDLFGLSRALLVLPALHILHLAALWISPNLGHSLLQLPRCFCSQASSLQ